MWRCSLCTPCIHIDRSIEWRITWLLLSSFYEWWFSVLTSRSVRMIWKLTRYASGIISIVHMIYIAVVHSFLGCLRVLDRYICIVSTTRYGILLMHIVGVILAAVWFGGRSCSSISSRSSLRSRDWSQCAWCFWTVVEASWVTFATMRCSLSYPIVRSLNTSSFLKLSVSSRIAWILHRHDFFKAICIIILARHHFHLWMSTMMKLRNISRHCWSNWLIVIVKCIIFSGLPFNLWRMRWNLSWLKLLFYDGSLSEIGHCWAFCVIESCSL